MNLTITENPSGILATLDGRLDTAAAQQLAIDMKPLMEKADQPITIDCTNMSFISSSGLRLFLSLRKETMAKGGSVTIKGVSEDVKKVFTITGFYSLFTFE